MLRRHGADEAFVAKELEAMGDVRVAPTNDRSTLGVMNEFAAHGGFDHRYAGVTDLDDMSLRLSRMIVRPRVA